MAHAHESSKKRIWIVLIMLTLITTVEVALGIVKPPYLHLTSILGTSPLNWIFIILTLVKAYYITWAFMHMEGEKKMAKTFCCLDSSFLNLLFSNAIVN